MAYLKDWCHWKGFSFKFWWYIPGICDKVATLKYIYTKCTVILEYFALTFPSVKVISNINECINECKLDCFEVLSSLNFLIFGLQRVLFVVKIKNFRGFAPTPPGGSERPLDPSSNIISLRSIFNASREIFLKISTF